jgi:hypothetical protein
MPLRGSDCRVRDAGRVHVADAHRHLPALNGKSSYDYRVLRGGDWGDPPGKIRIAPRP